jgi:hypothetical protein
MSLDRLNGSIDGALDPSETLGFKSRVALLDISPADGTREHNDWNRTYFFHYAKPIKEIDTGILSQVVIEQHHRRARTPWFGSIVEIWRRRF